MRWHELYRLRRFGSECVTCVTFRSLHFGGMRVAEEFGAIRDGSAGVQKRLLDYERRAWRVR